MSVSSESVASGEGVGNRFSAEGSNLAGPDQLLARMVEVELELAAERAGARVSEGFSGVLNLLDQVFVSDLSESSSLFGIEVYVVYHNRSTSEREVAHGRSGSSVPVKKLGDRLEFNVESYFVVLKSDQGESQSSVSAEPELEGNVESVLGENLSGVISGGNISESSHLSYITDELSVTSFLSTGVSELIPDVEEGSSLLVDLGSTDFDFNLFAESVSESSDPCDLVDTRQVTSQYSRDLDLECRVGCEITVSVYSYSVSASRLCRVNSLLDSFAGEVSVSSIYDLEESDLRITSEVYILSAIGY